MTAAIRSGDEAGLDVGAFIAALRRGAVPADLRPSKDYLAGHIPGAVSLPFARRGLGDALRQALPAGSPVVLVADNAVVAAAAAAAIAAAGYPVEGYLDGGMAAWDAAGYEVETAGEMPVGQLHGRLRRGEMALIDVRDPHEWAAGHVAGARHVPLAALRREAAAFDPNGEYALICATGARSGVACAILQQLGVPRVYNVSGGMSAWMEAGLPVTR